MAADFFDIRLLGEKDLVDVLKGYPVKIVSGFLRTSFRAASRRTLDRVLQHLSGNPVGFRTGALFTAFAQTKIRASFKKKTGLLKVGIQWPTREALGLTEEKRQEYYPSIVEYGSPKINVKARPYLRPSIDNFKVSELQIIRSDIRRAIVRKWKRDTKKMNAKIEAQAKRHQRLSRIAA